MEPEMSTLPLWTWVIGTVILGAIIAYGILRNRTRTRQDRIISNEATKELYRQENRSN
jgi:cytochrome c-type biogenesis protein CcmH/NrfF